MTRHVVGGGRGPSAEGVENHHGPDVHMGAVIRLFEFEERGVKRSETFGRRHDRDHPTIAPMLAAVRVCRTGGTEQRRA